MDMVLPLFLLFGVGALWLSWKRRRHSHGVRVDRDEDFSGLDQFRELATYPSTSSDRVYYLLGDVDSPQVSCTCLGFTYSSGEGCVHTAASITEHPLDEDGEPVQLGMPVRAPHRGDDGLFTDSPSRSMSKSEARDTVARWAVANSVVLDTETTGLSGKSKVLEVDVLGPDGEVLVNTLVDPGRSQITAGSRAIHGITRDDVRDKPTFDDVWRDLGPVLQRADVVLAYNMDFDLRMMAQSLSEEQRNELLGGIRTECIMRVYGAWSSASGKSRSKQSLAAALSECGLGPGGVHRAEETTVAALGVW